MQSSFVTRDGIAVDATRRPLDAATALDGLAERLDSTRGGLFSSGVDYPGRYSRWAFGFAEPPVEVVGHERRLALRALNARGEALVALLAPVLAATPDTVEVSRGPREAVVEVAAGA
ncbi:MAG: anthranilate synthase component I, partial [Alphaproteobacteria bacterium]